MKRRGFTLVEMLTVIAIISILATLLAGAMVNVMRTAREAAIMVEIGNLANALESYKAEFGEYPPDGTNTNDINNHIKKVFPRCTYTHANVPDWAKTPAGSLLFWLGGPMVNNRPVGFSKNPTNPFETGSTQRFTPKFEFSPTQITSYGNYLGYMARTGGAPYVYYRAIVRGGVGSYNTQFTGGSCKTYSWDNNVGSAVPYKISDKVWASETKYQIISPGLDGLYSFGSNNVSSTIQRGNQTNIMTEGDLDNLTSFNDGRLGNLIE